VVTSFQEQECDERTYRQGHGAKLKAARREVSIGAFHKVGHLAVGAIALEAHNSSGAIRQSNCARLSWRRGDRCRGKGSRSERHTICACGARSSTGLSDDARALSLLKFELSLRQVEVEWGASATMQFLSRPPRFGCCTDC